jgi:hypothetical protein
MSYRTADLYQAAYLRTKGAKLLDVEAGDYGRLVFVFEDGGSIDTWVKDFCNDSTINVQGFIASIRMLKGIVQNPYNGPSYSKRG